MDTDEGGDICSALKVRGYPAFVSFINGEMAESMLGASETELVAFFKATISDYYNFNIFLLFFLYLIMCFFCILPPPVLLHHHRTK